MIKNIFSFITITPQTSVCAYPCRGKRNMNLANETAGDQLSIQLNKSLISTKVEFVKNLYLAKTWEILKKILSMF